MAEENISTRGFEKNLNTDVSNFYVDKNSYSYAKNAINNSTTGDIGSIGNEPSNQLCITAPYTIIGFIYLYEDRWAIFSTDNTNSEIGLFVENRCIYTKVVNDTCLNFNTANLVTGISKQNFDCSWNIYWSDSHRNPDRTLNIDNVPYIQDCGTGPGNPPPIGVACPICIDTPNLDCNKLRLRPALLYPCIKTNRSFAGGSLANGTYYATVAYTINNQKVTDYFTISNPTSIFVHENLAGSIDVVIDNLDTVTYEQYELVIIAIVNQQTRAFKVGNYNTTQSRISIDILNNELTTVPLEFLPSTTYTSESSDHITRLDDYMIRVKPRSKFDFNYQPIANQILTHWVSIAYPAEYYKNSGANLSFLRDEVYTFFIQWIYDDGDLSSSYHIPGPAIGTPLSQIIYGTGVSIDAEGFMIAEGNMIPWQSTELYPNNPTVWGALCGLPIRHHKFPSQINNNFQLAHYREGAVPYLDGQVQILGTKFLNIKPPLDNVGNVITNIVGYRILRGDRQGNKSIIAKGIINNLLDVTTATDPVSVHIPNYPYNDISSDPFLSTTRTNSTFLGGNIANAAPVTVSDFDLLTFHSPDTQFKKPYLSVDFLKTYCIAEGTSTGQFLFPEDHPKYKLITNFLFLGAAVGGIALAVSQVGGEYTNTFKSTGVGYTTDYTGSPIPGAIVNTAGLLVNGIAITGTGVYNTALTTYSTTGGLSNLVNALIGTDVATGIMSGASATASLLPNANVGQTVSKTRGLFGNSGVAALGSSIPMFLTLMDQNFGNIVNAVKNATNFRHHALQVVSSGFYNNYTGNRNAVSSIKDAAYLAPTLQNFGTSRKINNLYRSKTVILDVVTPPIVTLADNSKYILSDVATSADEFEFPTTSKYNRTIQSSYCGLSLTIGNQYGQIGQIRQIPIDCAQRLSLRNVTPGQTFTSAVITGGDTYITRYAERNTMYFFSQWLYKQPNGYEYDYLQYPITAYPTFWVNTVEVDLSEFINNFISSLGALLSLGSLPSLTTPLFPTGARALDKFGGSFISANTGFFILKNCYFYLFNSGVRDFYVESEINTFFRDWEDGDEKRFYDHTAYNSLSDLFRVPHIRYEDYYKYDFGLSAGKNFLTQTSWANIQPNYYDPLVAETCYVNNPRRLIYSLKQQFTQVLDSWRVYLINNYKDFNSEITTLKSLNQNGALILFKTESPVMLQGSETLETDLGTKITVGDGTLFDKPFQNLSNAERPYEYGSCQNLRSVVNTPAGVYWISQNQGKIFGLSGGMMEITMQDLRWWFNTYLPYKLVEEFPTFTLTENAVIGLDCQSVYNNQDSLIYFTKKDYTKRKDFAFTMIHTSADNFLVNSVLPIKLGNLDYFEDCSWTISYDPKSKTWVSWHDWHPALLMPNKDTFLSAKANGLWRHNEVCDGYCNYYGTNYEFEIEYLSNTVQSVNTVRSVEYQLEVYKYDQNCHDRYMLLDENFDQAIIYNLEQVSGLLNLTLQPKNNPFAIVNYPIINPASIDILYTKVENKYRFNQFWDITDDRGEFTTAQRMIWNTANNGYTRILNAANLNYAKPSLEHKRFRGYTNTVSMKKKISGNKKFIINLFNNKQLYSSR